MRWFLRRMFPPRLPKPRQKYIGFVHAYSNSVNNETGEETYWDQYWILTETAGKRKAEAIGQETNSPFATDRIAQVKIWLVGGPLPKLGYARDFGSTPPKPRKSKPQPKRSGNVVAFAKRGAA